MSSSMNSDITTFQRVFCASGTAIKQSVPLAYRDSRGCVDKPLNKMTIKEIHAEMRWRRKAAQEMVGTLYPAINDTHLEALAQQLIVLRYPPCKTCGNKVHLAGATSCNNCWEVERRLDEWLQSDKARQIIVDKLSELGVLKV